MRRRFDIHREEDIRAILGGTRTSFRRHILPEPFQAEPTTRGALVGDWVFPFHESAPFSCRDPYSSLPLLGYAPWDLDDLLYVREPWALVDERGLPEGARPRRIAAYQASWNPEVKPSPAWRPARTCPDWVIRIHLRGTGVSVGRIQDPGPWPPGPPRPTGTAENSRETRLWYANSWVWVFRFEVAKAPGLGSSGA